MPPNPAEEELDETPKPVRDDVPVDERDDVPVWNWELRVTDVEATGPVGTVDDLEAGLVDVDDLSSTDEKKDRNPEEIEDERLAGGEEDDLLPTDVVRGGIVKIAEEELADVVPPPRPPDDERCVALDVVADEERAEDVKPAPDEVLDTEGIPTEDEKPVADEVPIADEGRADDEVKAEDGNPVEDERPDEDDKPDGADDDVLVWMLTSGESVEASPVDVDSVKNELLEVESVK